MSVKNILIGWLKKYGWLPTSIAEAKLSALRLKQCKRCDHVKTSKALQLLNGTANYVENLSCKKCGCPCEQKTLVVSEHCPEGKW